MSILADLLSKDKWGESHGGKDIPPTLTRAQGSPATKRSLKTRYIVLAVVCVAIIGIGLVMSSMLGRLATPKTVKYPLPPPAGPAIAPPQAIVAPPPQPAQQQTASTVAPSPAAEDTHKAKATFATKHVPKPHKHAIAQRHAASGSSQKASVKKQAVSARPPTEAASPARPDTDARGALLYAARSAELAGDWRAALANYRRALEIDPENYKIMSNAAAAFNNLGMFEEGARQAKKALDRKPGYVPALINAAIAYSSKGNSQEALRLFSAACAADPGNKNLAINLGILQERTGKLDEARVTYRSLAAANDPLALMGLGRISERKGDRTGAIYNYRRILGLAGASPAQKKEAKEKLARLEE